jgi:hypothetical protein
VYNHVKEDGARLSDVDIYIDPDPAGVLLDITDDESNLLCFASHDHVSPGAELRHSVGSHVIQQARYPFIVVGAHAEPGPASGDVVVALDGRSENDPLLDVAATWAGRLGAALRIVTVYEPVLADLRDPQHFSRGRGPAGDPDAYLASARGHVTGRGVATVEVVAIPDPVSVTAGLEKNLADDPARLMIVGGRPGAHLVPGVLGHLLPNTPIPMMVVNVRG